MKNPSIGGTNQETRENRAPQIRELVTDFLRLGTLGFGGPVAMCGLMEPLQFCVTEKCGYGPQHLTV
jgi:hypothetical protein